jgi:hypothetical protein
MAAMLSLCLTASCFNSVAAADNQLIYPDVNAVAGAAAVDEPVL